MVIEFRYRTPAVFLHQIIEFLGIILKSLRSAGVEAVSYRKIFEIPEDRFYFHQDIYDRALPTVLPFREQTLPNFSHKKIKDLPSGLAYLTPGQCTGARFCF
jgi:hypothetical protein